MRQRTRYSARSAPQYGLLIIKDVHILKQFILKSERIYLIQNLDEYLIHGQELNTDITSQLKKPKLMYFDWLSGTEMDANIVTDIIDDAIDKSEKLKQRFQMEKMTLSWNEYKKVVEGFLRRCFDNCKLIEEYEDKTQIINNYDFITEDNFYVKYINRSLDGEMRKYQKQYYGIRDHKKYSRCKRCGGIIEKTGNKRLYCCDCATLNERERKRKIAHKYRVAK